MYLAISRADDWPGLVSALADAETQFEDPWSDPAVNSLAAFTSTGQVVALARTFMNPQFEGEARCYFDAEVHPAHRGRGLEDFVLEWAEARGRQRLQAAPPGASGRLLHGTVDSRADHLARLERNGFAPVRYFYRMRRDLREPIPDGPLPAGLTLRTFTPEMSQRLLDAFNEAFRDHWNFEWVSEADWEMFFLKRTSFRPDLSFLAMDGDEIAGFSFNTVSPEENERNGLQEGEVAELAVRRPWRKRGVASALLCETMRAFKTEGLDYARLGVDAENPTGALGLYEGLGFKQVKRFIMLGKAVG
jgi:mycothiol synthase